MYFGWYNTDKQQYLDIDIMHIRAMSKNQKLLVHFSFIFYFCCAYVMSVYKIGGTITSELQDIKSNS